MPERCPNNSPRHVPGRPSSRGIGAQKARSCFRLIDRETLKPHVIGSSPPKRSVEKGILISVLQPSAVTTERHSQMPSQEVAFPDAVPGSIVESRIRN